MQQPYVCVLVVQSYLVLPFSLILPSFAMDNFLWRRHYGTGERYAMSDWVQMNEDMSTSVLRELSATMMYDPQVY
jgi:hypothetical protein